ncbi:MAG: M48 family metallopeptidase [Verrucomicrobia bacterium]|nr:M48 family metallopeptidase [Verrucomicrobiota bacterium]
MALDWTQPAFLAGTVLILARVAGELALERLNARHVEEHATELPEELRAATDPGTHRRAVEYTLAKSRLAMAASWLEGVLLLAVLWSGLLPWLWSRTGTAASGSVWGAAGFVLLVGAAFSAAGLPVSWYAQFRLEERFGFNRTTQRTWWLDRFKGFLLSLALLWPLLALILKLVEWMGGTWWLWAWGVVLMVQVTVAALMPVVILPLFNNLRPLAAGPLRDRLLALADRTHFKIRDLLVMDGSRRSRHSNAFFAGLGRFRRIILFDTLIEQLTGEELEAVLAHEIGHYRRRHVPKMLGAMAVGLLAGLGLLGWLAGQQPFYAAFGFADPHPAVAILLFGLLGGAVAFWLSPLMNWWSRRFEYEADEFAAKMMGSPDALVRALRRLSGENLSNLTPHPWYSVFHHSHPTLLQRERALIRGAALPG